MPEPQAHPPSRLRPHIPNALTIARIVLAVAFFAVLTPWSYQSSPLFEGKSPDFTLLAAAAIFILAALTDALDGYLARRWRVVSVFGRIMDPFADKLLVIGAFVFLAGPGFAGVSAVHPWMVALILARELLITSIRGVMESQGVSFAASLSGKLKMILQSICIPAVLVLLNVPAPHGEGAGGWAHTAITVLVWCTVLVTAWSGIPYILRAVKAARASRPLEKPQ